MEIEKRLDAAGIEFPSNMIKEELDKVEEKKVYINKHDELFQQIDAFRQKAEDIQSLIKEREDRVSDLEELLRQKEAQNQETQNKIAELEDELAQKQKEADSIVANVETQVDRALGELKQPLDTMSESVEGMKEGLYEKVHDENVRVYRNIQDLLKERDEADKRFEETQAMVKKLGGRVGFLTFLALLNLGVVVAVLLALLDII